MYFIFTATRNGNTETYITFSEAEAKTICSREIKNPINVTVEVSKRGQIEPIYRRDFVAI